MSYNKTHDGWQYFKGINKERLKKGKEDEAIIFKKLESLNALPVGEFIPTKAWNNRVDFKSEDISIEIKRRFLKSSDEYPFKLDKTKKSTLITYKKFQHLKENSGWLFLQYDDGLYRLNCAELPDDQWVECYPFRVQHVSICLNAFDKLD